MTKLKCFILSSKLEIEDISRKFRTFSAGPDFKYKVEILQCRHEFLYAKYYEKTQKQQKITKPNGDEEILEYETYIIFDFFFDAINESEILVSIINPPRALKNFTLFLAKELDTKAYFKSTKIETSSFLGEFSNEIKGRVTVKSLKAVAIPLNMNSTFDVVIKSRENAMEDFHSLTTERPPLIKQLTFGFSYLEAPAELTVSSSGSFRVKSHDDLGILDVVRKCIRNKILA